MKEKIQLFNNFIDEQRLKIKNNILEFFQINVESMEIEISNILPILSFSVNVEYSFQYFINNIQYLTLKYFNVQIKNNKINKENISGYIDYLFPLVEEVLVDIYNFIINKYGTIYKILKDSKIISSGTQGNLFEKYVIYNINPINNSYHSILLFNSICITKNEIVAKILPNENENFRENKGKITKKILKDGVYLFEQRIFGGKSFDAAIIELKTVNNIQEAKVYLLQISIHKRDIFDINRLQKDILIMIEYFDIYYSFIIKKENVYFTYIFEKGIPKDDSQIKVEEKDTRSTAEKISDFVTNNSNSILAVIDVIGCLPLHTPSIGRTIVRVVNFIDGKIDNFRNNNNNQNNNIDNAQLNEYNNLIKAHPELRN